MVLGKMAKLLKLPEKLHSRTGETTSTVEASKVTMSPNSEAADTGETPWGRGPYNPGPTV